MYYIIITSTDIRSLRIKTRKCQASGILFLLPGDHNVRQFVGECEERGAPSVGDVYQSKDRETVIVCVWDKNVC